MYIFTVFMWWSSWRLSKWLWWRSRLVCCMYGSFITLTTILFFSYLIYSNFLILIAKRPPKDTIRRFLTAQYSNYGPKFIEYMFGSKALAMFSKWPTVKAIDVIAITLAGNFLFFPFSLYKHLNLIFYFFLKFLQPLMNLLK